MRVHLDTERCAGHGRCYTLAPDFFEDDERGYSALTGDGRVPAEAEALVCSVVLACPEQAITIVDEQDQPSRR